MTSRRALAAVLTAVLVAAIAHFSTVFVFFVTNGSAPDQLAPINTYFIPASLLLAVLLIIGGWIGVFARWFTALAAGLIGASIASLAGTTIGFVAAGNVVTRAILPELFSTLYGSGLTFIAAASIAASTAGVAIWRRIEATGRSGARIALVRSPAHNLADGQLTHIERSPIDTDLADAQWDAYVEVLDRAGFRVVEVDAADTLPDSVFIEDPVVVLGDTAIITNPGAESRRAEIVGAEAAVRGLGLKLERIEEPGTLEGGDVLVVDSTVFVGRSSRTNAEGIRQLRAIANRLGYRVVSVPVTRALHLKSCVTALPDGTVIGFAPLVDRPELFPRFLAIPEASGAAVVVLAHDTVLISAAAPQTAALIADLGYRVISVDVSEFEKLEGCVTCLSVRIEALS